MHTDADGGTHTHTEAMTSNPGDMLFMATMRILNPTAIRQAELRALHPFGATDRIGLLHNHSPHFDRLAAALPEALQPALQARVVKTYRKERYSSGAPESMLQRLSTDYDLAITGMAA